MRLAWLFVLAAACADDTGAACTAARDHLVALRFAPVLHDPEAVWRLLVEEGGADNVDRRALLAALKVPHDEAWYEALRDRQRYSPQMRKWQRTCVQRGSARYARCIAAATTDERTRACEVVP